MFTPYDIPVILTGRRLYSPGGHPLVAERNKGFAEISLPSLGSLIDQSRNRTFFPMRPGIPFKLSTLPFRDNQSGPINLQKLLQYLVITEQLERPGLPEIQEAILSLKAMGISYPEKFIRRR